MPDIPCVTTTAVHFRPHALHLRNLTNPSLCDRNPLETLLVAEQYGHLCGLPRPIQITSGTSQVLVLLFCVLK